MQEYWRNYIGGTFVDGGSARIDALDPATGSVIIRDLDRTTRVARKMRSGQVLLNRWYSGDFGSPGHGREKECEALGNHVQTKFNAVKPGG